jgi:tetratricopeptide (TPR) repeat protein
VGDDLYATLHVTADAEPRDLKKAYFGLIRQFPPETHAEEFQKIRAAWEVLGNPDARKAYDASRGVASSAQLGDELAVIMRSALEAIEAREWERAIPLLEGVVKERPEAQEARARLCGCLLNLQRPGEAGMHATELARHHPTLAQAPLLAGYAAMALKRWTEARAHFVRAAELDPLDFRPIRSVVDVDLQEREGKSALAFLDEKLAAAPESMRLGLRMERVSVLHFLERISDADQELNALEREATTPELKEELGWFYEREAASHFARTKHARADAILARLGATAPTRGSVALTKPVTLPLKTIPAAALTWLLAQREKPELFFLGGHGLITDSLLMLGAAAIFGAVVLLGFNSTSVWSLGEQIFSGVVFSATGAMFGATALRWTRALMSPVGNFSVVHRIYFIDVAVDEVRFMPLMRLSSINATHQGTNGVYSHTTFGLAFGNESRNFSVNSRYRAEELGKLLHQLRGRLLDLLHSGMLAGEEGADLLPSNLFDHPAAPQPSRRPRWVMGGAALGVLLCLLAGVMAARAFHEKNWLDAMADGSAGTLRKYLATRPPERFVKEAERALLDAKATAVKRLDTNAPRLARALENTDPGSPTLLFVDFAGEGTAATLVPPAGSKLAELPGSEFLPLGRERHENELIDSLQQRVDQQAGAGWFTVKRGTGPLTLRLTYRLSLSGGVYRFKSTGAPSPVLWPEALLEGTATLGDERRVLVATSARVVQLPEQIVAALNKGDSSTAGSLVFESVWTELGNQLSLLLGVSKG